MGHGHSTDDVASLGQAPRTRRALVVAVGACALATLVGLIALWPRGPEPRLAIFDEASELVDVSITDVRQVACVGSNPDDGLICEEIRFEVTGGSTEGDTGSIELALDSGLPELEPGDDAVFNYFDQGPEEFRYSYADFQRSTPLLALAGLFALAVVLLGRLQGVRALLGLIVSLAVLVVFLLPALLQGSSPLAVALVGAASIAFLALYLAHGVNQRTTVALLGTLTSLVLTVGLAVVFVALTRLTGLADEDAAFLDITAGQVDLRGLLLAGIVIGTLGVLDDVTVTQVSAVSEIHAAAPGAEPRRIYLAALRVGRDHIASTVNTLVLAYAGAALPLLILLSVANQRSLGQILSSEVVAVEIVRTLVGSIGLVASVPITTALAVAVIAGVRREEAEPDPVVEAGPRSPNPPPDPRPPPPAADPDWDDFTPRQEDW